MTEENESQLDRIERKLDGIVEFIEMVSKLAGPYVPKGNDTTPPAVGRPW